MVVGTEAALPPFEFIRDGKIVGYGRDILDYVAKDMGVQVEQLDLPWQGILPGVDAGKFDLVATSVTLTPERAQKYAFTFPIAESTHHVLKRKGDKGINVADDLIGKRVGVQLGAQSRQHRPHHIATRATHDVAQIYDLHNYGSARPSACICSSTRR